jgi:hypothetical protein
MFSRHLVVTIGVIVTLLISFLPGCKGGGAPAFPIEVQFSFSEPPVLGKPVQVTATFNLIEGYFKKTVNNVDAQIVLSEGFQLVDGTLEWEGDFVLDQTYQIFATVKSVKTGTWKIGAQALFSPGEGAIDGGAKALYVTVTENSASISDRPPSGPSKPPVRTSAPSPQNSAVQGQSLPLITSLTFSEPPTLNQPVQITAGFTINEGYNEDLNDVTACITLSDGLEKIDGDPSRWLVTMQGN